MDKILLTLILFFALLTLLALTSDHAGEQKNERKSYCELVSMWEQDAEQGIESVKRNGHPNYKGLECE